MIHERIKDEIKKAMLARDTVRLETVRGVSAAFVNELVATKRTPQEKLSDDEAIAVMKRLAKQRKDSIEQFEKGGRQDLADKEKQELAILGSFLPAGIGRDEIRRIAEAKKAELGITDKSKMGILVGAVMKELKGKADGGDVREVVEQMMR